MDQRIVQELWTDINAHGFGLARHCLDVAELARCVARRNRVAVDPGHLAAAAILHDYGKLVWPDGLFAKVGLTPSDWAIINAHPVVGRAMVADRWPGCPETILRLIEEHHRPNDWVPAQVLAACDVYVACREPRAYRAEQLPIKDVVQEMYRVAPTAVVQMVLEAASEAGRQVGMS